MANLFRPASAIVNEVLLQELGDAPCPSLPKPVNLVRAANYLRKQIRPTDPTDLTFDLEEQHIPDGFLREDINVSIIATIIAAKIETQKVITSNMLLYNKAYPKSAELCTIYYIA